MKTLPLILSLLLATTAALAQDSTRAAGEAGAALGEQLLNAAKKPAEYDPAGGTRDAGTLEIEGVGKIDLNDLAPGADRAEIERLGKIDGGSDEAVLEGEAAFNRGVNANGGNGEALRAFTESTVNERRVGRSLVDAGTLSASQAAIESASTGSTAAFGQCEVVTEQVPGQILVGSRQVERTCSVSEGAETCGRVLDLEIIRGPSRTAVLASQSVTVGEEAMVSLPASDPAVASGGLPVTVTVESLNRDIRAGLMVMPEAGNGFTAEVSVLRVGSASCGAGPCDTVTGEIRLVATFEEPPTVNASTQVVGVCEVEGAANGCSVSWECADSRPREVNGFRVTESFLADFGVEPMVAGLPRLCWAARPVFSCSVCSVEEGGFSNCETAVIRGPAGNTCGALEADGACRVQREECVVFDVDGTTCLEKARTYACAERTETVVTETVTRNTCDAPAACIGDGCRSQDQLQPQSQGNSLQMAAASLAVMDTVINDWQRGAGAGGGTGSGSGSGPGSSSPGDREDGGVVVIGKNAPGTPPGAQERDPGVEWGFDEEAGGYDPNDPEQLPSLDGLADPQLDEVKLFSGKAGTCKKGWAGLVQCCSKTNTDGPQRYWTMFQQQSKERQAAMLAQSGGDTDSWSDVLAGGQVSLDSLRAGFTNNRDSLQGAGDGAKAGDTASIHESFMATARREIRPNLKPSWICSEKEFDLAVQRELGMCSYAGTYCSRKVLGVCLQRKESYCCYNSPMSRMLRASVEGGTMDHGSAKRPDCSGISVDRIDEINFDAIPWDELMGRMGEGDALPTDAERENAVERYTGTGASYGGAGRVNAVDRTQERVGEIASSGAREQMEADGLERYPVEAVIEGSGSGEVAFSPSFATLRPGLPGVLTLARSGVGAASVVVTLVQGSAQTAGFYSERVTLPAEGGTVNVRLDVRDAQPGEEWVFEISSPQGVAIGAAPTTTLRYGGQ